MVKRKTIVAFAVMAAVVGGGYFYLRQLVYYPVVQLTLPDGLSIVAVLPETKDRKACGTATERFVAPFNSCKECKIIRTRCERELTGLELAMSQGAPVPHPVVVAQELRIAVIGPTDVAKASCKIVAADMVAKGMKSAACIQQALPIPKS